MDSKKISVRKSAECIMGCLSSVYAYSSLTVGCFKPYLTISFIKKESFNIILKLERVSASGTQTGSWFHIRGV